MNFWDNLIPEARDGILAINTIEDIPLFYEKLDIIQMHNFTQEDKPSFVSQIEFIHPYTKEDFSWELFYKILNESFKVKVITCTMSAMLINLILDQKLNKIANLENYIAIQAKSSKDDSSYKILYVHNMCFMIRDGIYYRYMHPKFNIESVRSTKFKEKLRSEKELTNYNEYMVKIDSMDDYFKDLILDKQNLATTENASAAVNIYKFNVFELPWYEYTSKTYVYKILKTKRPILIL